MRKFLLCSLILMLLLFVCAHAASINVELLDAGEDIIRVYGCANDGENVSVMILNPGYTKDMLISNGKDAVSYYKRTKAGKDGFSIDIGMYHKENKGGLYTVIVSTENSIENDTFKFYFEGEKLSVIDKIGSEELGAVLKELYSVYDLDRSEVYTKTPINTLLEIFGRKTDFERDADKMFSYLKETLYTSAYKSGNNAVIVDGKITGVDIIGLEEEDLYKDYLTLLSGDGMKSVNAKLLSSGCDSIEEIKNDFKEITLLHLICDYKDMGYGHVDDMFLKYENEYKAAGIDPAKLDNITNKNSVYLTLSNSSAKNLNVLKEEYEAALLVADATVDDPPSVDDEPSGNSPSGGRAPSGGGGGKVQVTGPSDENSGYIERPKVPFTDLESVPWAEESIGHLYKMGVISGRNEKDFDPNDSVTREEFTKMIILALFGEEEGEACTFTDVSGWALPYIAIAEERGIISGDENKMFLPKQNINREQAAVIVSRALEECGFESEKNGKPFKDDNTISDWAKEGISMLTGEGVLSGRGDGSFYPLDNMTRAEAAKIIYHAFTLTGGGTK